MQSSLASHSSTGVSESYQVAPTPPETSPQPHSQRSLQPTVMGRAMSLSHLSLRPSVYPPNIHSLLQNSQDLQGPDATGANSPLCPTDHCVTAYHAHTDMKADKCHSGTGHGMNGPTSLASTFLRGSHSVPPRHNQTSRPWDPQFSLSSLSALLHGPHCPPVPRSHSDPVMATSSTPAHIQVCSWPLHATLSWHPESAWQIQSESLLPWTQGGPHASGSP